ncbi:MAG TPA: sensor domain-containing diguanylate cyclase [Xanthomonadaceae bacterium]|nr:sensor domain-containing diguanylate cyclase [Xanthomonadaceae bacterium]
MAPPVDEALPAVAAAIPVALYVFRGTALVGANDSAWRLLGFSPGTQLGALLAALDPDRQLRAQLATIGDGPLQEAGRHMARARDGNAPCLELHIGPARGDPATRIVAANDCTRWHGIESQLQRRLAFERLLTGASAQLIRTTGPALDDAIVAVLGTVGTFFDVDRAYVFLFDEAAGTQSNTHEWVAAGISREAHNLQDVPLATFPWLMARLRTDRVFQVERVADLPPEATNERTEFEREGILSILVVPLWQGSTLQGLVGFDAVRRHVAWDDHFVVGLRLMTQMIASALEARTLAERLHDQAFRDPLTGLPNRKLLEDRFAQAAGRLQRNGASVLVAVVDVDDFKQVNDTHGHAVGDQLLCEVGRRLQSAVRGTDTVSRMGGDEFVVLAEECGPDALARLADRLLGACDTPLDIDGHALQVGLSIGVARGIAPVDGLDGLLRAADAAMYRAKAEGKHRWLEAAPLG